MFVSYTADIRINAFTVKTIHSIVNTTVWIRWTDSCVATLGGLTNYAQFLGTYKAYSERLQRKDVLRRNMEWSTKIEKPCHVMLFKVSVISSKTKTKALSKGHPEALFVVWSLRHLCVTAADITSCPWTYAYIQRRFLWYQLCYPAIFSHLRRAPALNCLRSELFARLPNWRLWQKRLPVSFW